MFTSSSFTFGAMAEGSFTLGIVRESKTPPDTRTPLPPYLCESLIEKFGITILVQPSPHRCYRDEEYTSVGCLLKEDLSECDLILGIKEIAVYMLLKGKTYMFFSHTHKQQPYNRGLLQEVMRQKITLIDYELLTDEGGTRLIGFGHWAGIVGAHYAIKMWGKRKGSFSLPQASQVGTYQGLKSLYLNLQVPDVNIALTGGGKVAHGAIEVLKALDFKEVSPSEYLTIATKGRNYVHLRSRHLYHKKGDVLFNSLDFYAHPSEYQSTFRPYLEKSQILINAMYWHPGTPPLFTEEEARHPTFPLKTISDISCDIKGSSPITFKHTTTASPVYGYNQSTKEEVEPYALDTIDIMSIENLPSELPKDASATFGQTLSELIIPAYLQNPEGEPFKGATITKNGDLTKAYQYLAPFARGE